MVDESQPERARRPAASYVPILHDDATSEFIGLVLVRNFAEAQGEIEAGLPVWILETAFVDDARERYAWMLTRPERWAVWARLAPLVGPEMLTLMMEHEQDRDARRAAELQADVDRLAREARTITARSTEVLGRPCVTLRRGSEREPFLTVPFDDPVERDRLWDWVRWQTHRYRGWRILWDDKGPVALRRLIVRSMFRDEERVRNAGLASAGRRPLRLWHSDREGGSTT
ncbi:hypothetical protein [Sphingomonas sp. PP-CC-3G-468]|uniref:hypothetical protein n=1 Tax=Sphingomonas sp. PP-CC-3G-468 TaxID=2135656 RepID=UPI001044CF54|nr:hypothetical protein [Sphingomonas sp. PP-CC-3G-468]TCM07366.1 hypothetical protein C8J41_103274 [Sphingomonas sp. PP-CC-3G-468]